jgi:hypothetical protein
VVERPQTYVAAGVEEIMIQWISLEDLQAITVIAEDVLPHV